MGCFDGEDVVSVVAAVLDGACDFDPHVFGVALSGWEVNHDSVRGSISGAAAYSKAADDELVFWHVFFAVDEAGEFDFFAYEVVFEKVDGRKDFHVYFWFYDDGVFFVKDHADFGKVFIPLVICVEYFWSSASDLAIAGVSVVEAGAGLLAGTSVYRWNC